MEQKHLKMDSEGFKNYQKKIEQLENEVADVRKYKGEVAIFQGDTWHDNPELEYTEAKEKRLMFRIAKMKNNLKNIEIIEKNDNPNIVCIGDKLRIIITEDNESEEMIIELVSDVSDLNSNVNQVSINSLLGQAILDKEIGKLVEYISNNQCIKVKILEKIL